MADSRMRPVLLRKHWKDFTPGSVVGVTEDEAVPMVVNHLGEAISMGEHAWHIADGEAHDGPDPKKRQRVVVLTAARDPNVPGDQCVLGENEAVELVKARKAAPVGDGNFAWHVDDEGRAVDGPKPPPPPPEPEEVEEHSPDTGTALSQGEATDDDTPKLPQGEGVEPPPQPPSPEGGEEPQSDGGADGQGGEKPPTPEAETTGAAEAAEDASDAATEDAAEKGEQP